MNDVASSFAEVEIQAKWRDEVVTWLSTSFPEVATEERIFEVEMRMRELLSDATMRIRLSPRSLRGFLQEGRFRTIFDIEPALFAAGHHPDSRGPRALFESSAFNYSPSIEPDRTRPAYGYVYDGSEDEPLDFLDHWTVIAHLKRHACRDVTLTFADSLWATDGGTKRVISPSWIRREALDCRPEWISAPLCHGDDLSETESLADLKVTAGDVRVQSYVEAQLHFDLEPDSVAFVEFVEFEERVDYAELFHLLRDSSIGWFPPLAEAEPGGSL